MFSTGRIVFTIIFVILFIATMIWAYRKDMKQVGESFSKPWIVLLAIIGIYIIYFIFSRFV